MAGFEDEILIKDVTGRFKILRGGKLYDLEEIKPKAVTLPVKSLAEEVLKESKIAVAENLEERLEEILEAYQKDVRDKFETKSTLMQKIEAGGMGFTAEQADLIIKLIDKIKIKLEKEEKPLQKELPPPTSPEVTKVLEIPTGVPPAPPVPPAVPTLEVPTGAPPVPPTAPTAPTPAVSPITPGVAEFVFSPADEQEILAHQEKLPLILKGLKTIEVARLVYDIIKESGIVLEPEKQKKIENIILTHLKDIRDGFETYATLMRATEPAGIVLAREQIERLLEIARNKLRDLEEKLKEKAEREIKEVMEREKLKQKEMWQKAEEEVKKKIEARWQEITKKPALRAQIAIGSELISPPIALRPKIPRPAIPTPPTIVKAGETPQVVEMSLSPREAPKVEKVSEKKVVPEKTLVPSEERPKVSPLLSKISLPKEAKVEEKPKPLEILKPKPTVIRRPIPPESGRPRVEDIKVVPRLIGPIEELEEMTLTDFRRLALNPSEAALKIKDKINLLEKESFTKKIQGIQAWQKSEVNQLYLEIAKESLEKGKSISEILAERASAGKPYLTEEEFQVIMDLNKILRF